MTVVSEIVSGICLVFSIRTKWSTNCQTDFAIPKPVLPVSIAKDWK